MGKKQTVNTSVKSNCIILRDGAGVEKVRDTECVLECGLSEPAFFPRICEKMQSEL